MIIVINIISECSRQNTRGTTHFISEGDNLKNCCSLLFIILQGMVSVSYYVQRIHIVNRVAFHSWNGTNAV